MIEPGKPVVQAGYPSRELLEEMLGSQNVMQDVEDALRQQLNGHATRPQNRTT